MKLKLWFVAVLAALTIGRIAAQTPDLDFQRVQQRAQVNGDWKKAIADYQRILDNPSTSPATAAKAMLAQGEAYQALGDPKAYGAFADVVKRYPGERGPVAAANNYLASVPALQQAERLEGRLLDGDVPLSAEISADGRLVFFTSPNGGLSVKELSTGATRSLLAGTTGDIQTSGAVRGATVQAWAASPDGALIAYALTELNIDRIPANGGSLPPGAVRSAVRIMALDGRIPPRIVFTDTNNQITGPVAWSPDGSAILAGTSAPGANMPTELVWISVSDGSRTPIRTFEGWQHASRPALSPDGRLIAVAVAPTPNSQERRIFVMPARGGTAVDVTASVAANNDQPTWTPDGGYLVFTSQGSGANAKRLLAIGVRDGGPVGEAIVLDQTFDGQLRGFTQGGGLIYGRTYGGGQHIFSAPIDGAGPTKDVAFGYSPTPSPDGRSIAFGRPGARGPVFGVRSAATGEERMFPHDGMGVLAPRWLGDGSAFLVQVSGAGNPGTIHRVDAATGAFSEVMPLVTPEGRRGNLLAVSSDGSTIFTAIVDQQNLVRLIAVEVATGQSRVIFEPPNKEGAISLALNVIGTTLAAAQALPGGRALLFTVGIDGSGYRELFGPFPTPRNWDLHAWAPDGAAVLFVVTQPDGQWQLMRIPANGGTATPTGLSWSGLTTRQPELRLQQAAPFRLAVMPDGRSVILGAQTRPTTELRAFDNVIAVINARR